MKTKVIQIGDRVIGGGNPILIQSMCNTKTEDVAATVSQILKLEQAGCDIIRVAVQMCIRDRYYCYRGLPCLSGFFWPC